MDQVPRISIGTSVSWVTQKVENESIIPYLSFPVSASLLSTSGEIEVSLTNVSRLNRKVAVKTGDQTLTGTLLEVNDNLISLQCEGVDGVITTKYDHYVLASSPYPLSKNTFKVMYNPEGLTGVPELRYMTDSIKWKPVSRLQIHGKTATLSLNAVITSSRAESIHAKFSVFFDEVDSMREKFSKDVGTFMLNGIVIYPFYVNEVSFDKFTHIDITKISSESRCGQHSYVFAAPFDIPPCDFEFHDVDTSQMVTLADQKSIMRKEMMMVPRYPNTKTTYRLTQSEFYTAGSSSGSSSSTQPAIYERIIKVSVSRKSLNSEKILFTYKLPKTAVLIETEPKALDWKFAAKNTITWMCVASTQENETSFTIKYKN